MLGPPGHVLPVGLYQQLAVSLNFLEAIIEQPDILEYLNVKYLVFVLNIN